MVMRSDEGAVNSTNSICFVFFVGFFLVAERREMKGTEEEGRTARGFGKVE